MELVNENANDYISLKSIVIDITDALIENKIIKLKDEELTQDILLDFLSNKLINKG